MLEHVSLYDKYLVYKEISERNHTKTFFVRTFILHTHGHARGCIRREGYRFGKQQSHDHIHKDPKMRMRSRELISPQDCLLSSPGAVLSSSWRGIETSKTTYELGCGSRRLTFDQRQWQGHFPFSSDIVLPDNPLSNSSNCATPALQVFDGSRVESSIGTRVIHLFRCAISPLHLVHQHSILNGSTQSLGN